MMGIKGKLVFEDSFCFLISPNYFLYGKPSLSLINITAIKIRLPISVAWRGKSPFVMETLGKVWCLIFSCIKNIHKKSNVAFNIDKQTNKTPTLLDQMARICVAWACRLHSRGQDGRTKHLCLGYTGRWHLKSNKERLSPCQTQLFFVQSSGVVLIDFPKQKCVFLTEGSLMGQPTESPSPLHTWPRRKPELERS